MSLLNAVESENVGIPRQENKMEVKIELGPLTKLGYMVLSMAIWPLNIIAWIYEWAIEDTRNLHIFLGITAVAGWILGGVMTLVFLVLWGVVGFYLSVGLVTWFIIGYGFWAGRKCDWKYL
jgi:hypothetical protein